MKKRLLNSEMIFGALLGIVAVAFILISLQFPAGTHDGVPGPGYFPILAASVVLLLSVILMVQGFLHPKTFFALTADEKGNLVQVLLIIGTVLAFLVLWQFVPFVIAASALVFGMCLVLKCNIKFSAIYSVALVGILYVIFSIAFRVNLDLI